MTQFSEKTERIIIEDIKKIQDDAKKIVKLCDVCLRLIKRKDAGDINTWASDWSEITTEIRELYENMQYIMETKRGRF